MNGSASTAFAEQDETILSRPDEFARAAALTTWFVMSASSRAIRSAALAISGATTTAPRIEHVASATEADREVKQLSADIARKFEEWRELRFEDGTENDVSRELWNLLSKRPSQTVEALTAIISAGQVSPRVAAEALRHVGRYTQPSTHRARLWLLAHSLRLSSPLGRDGAALGLAHLNDPAAIQYLEEAISKEANQTLKEDMQQVLDGLRETKDAVAD
jgi:hypothetical protein